MRNRLYGHFRKVRRELGPDNTIVLGIVAIMSFGSVNFLVSKLVSFISPEAGRLASAVLYAIVAYVGVLTLPYVLNRINRIQLVVIGLFGIIYIISFLFSNLKNDFYTDFRVLVLTGFPLYFLFGSIQNENKAIEWLGSAATIIAFAQLMSATVFRNEWVRDYAMGVSYQSYLAFIMITAASIHRPRVWKFIAILFSLIAIIISGTRGPFFLAFIAIIVMGIYGCLKKCTKRAQLLVFTGLIVVFLVLIICFDDLMNLLESMPSLSEYSRAIRMLRSGQFFRSYARLDRYEASLKVATSNIILGTGIINDRFHIGQVLNMGPTYSHNVVLEVIVQFGLLPGVLIVLLFIRRLLHKFRDSTSFSSELLLIFLFLIGMLPLMVSHSYIRWAPFFALLGYLFSSNGPGFFANRKWFRA